VPITRSILLAADVAEMVPEDKRISVLAKNISHRNDVVGAIHETRAPFDRRGDVPQHPRLRLPLAPEHDVGLSEGVSVDESPWLLQEFPPVIPDIPLFAIVCLRLVFTAGVEKLHEAELIFHHKYSSIMRPIRVCWSKEIDPNGVCAAGA